MKIFGSFSLSYYLFFACRICAIAISVFILFILISFSIGNFHLVDNQFQISIPFFPETFVKGFYESNIILTITLTMIYLIIFFTMLSNILKTFKAEKLFTTSAIKQLNYFALLNLLMGPLLYLVIHFFIMKKNSFENIYNLFLSFILGFFVLFLAALFKKGFIVQNENDLTI